MKQGKSLIQLAEEVQRQAQTKRDFLADTSQLSLATTPEHGSLIRVAHAGDFAVRPQAHRQLAERLAIPQKFYDRLQSTHPDILDFTVNTLFQREPERRLIRTIDGQARAFLSDRYRRLDHYDLLEAVLPVIQAQPELRVESCEITETRLYLKLVFPRISGTVRGEIVQSGVVVSNSEVGAGAIWVKPLTFVLACLNGAIYEAWGQRRHHVGRIEESESVELFSDETLKADDQAFWLKVRDTVLATLDESKFAKLLDLQRDAAERRITGDPVKAVELLTQRFAFSDADRGGILNHLVAGGDLSQWGLSNAVTRHAQDVADYDVATDLERAGAQVITLPPSDWRVISSGEGALGKAA